MFKLLIGLIAVMIANFLLGTNLAKLKDEYNREKMKSGLLKIVGIVLGVGAMLICAYFTQDIIVANINNQNVNLLDAMRLIFISGITFYGAQAIEKLVSTLQVKVEIENKTEEQTISIPEKNIIKVEESE